MNLELLNYIFELFLIDIKVRLKAFDLNDNDYNIFNTYVIRKSLPQFC